MKGFEVQIVTTPEQYDAIASVQSLGFAATTEDVTTWHRTFEPENQRLGWLDGKPAGAVGLIPMGQFFGGASLPMLGICGVATAPEMRRKGVAREMMKSVLTEARNQYPISALYGANRKLYRGLGYEVAGSYYTHSVDPRRAPHGERALEMRRLTERDRPTMQALHERTARSRSGNLHRGSYVWSRVFRPRAKETFSFGFFDRQELAGYLVYRFEPGPHGLHELVLTDCVLPTQETISSTLAFFSDQTLTSKVTWHGSAADPLAERFEFGIVEVILTEPWMLRVLDPMRALERRGYSPASNLAFDLRVEDPLFEENREPFRVQVEGGRATCALGGSADLVLSPGALAQLFTGYRSATSLQALGQLQGSSRAIAMADALFAGEPPFSTDWF